MKIERIKGDSDHLLIVFDTHKYRVSFDDEKMKGSNLYLWFTHELSEDIKESIREVLTEKEIKSYTEYRYKTCATLYTKWARSLHSLIHEESERMMIWTRNKIIKRIDRIIKY